MNEPTGGPATDPTGPPVKVMVVTAAVVIAVALVLVALGRPPVDHAASAGGPVGVGAPGAPAPATDEPGMSDRDPADPSSTVVTTTAITTTTVPTTTAPRSGPTTSPVPAPFIQRFAELPGATPQYPLAGPPVDPPRQTEVDGCDRHYGHLTQCVPLAFPPGTPDRCRWLLDRSYGPLPVNGDDRQHLDANGDGTACGPGD